MAGNALQAATANLLAQLQAGGGAAAGAPAGSGDGHVAGIGYVAGLAPTAEPLEPGSITADDAIRQIQANAAQQVQAAPGSQYETLWETMAAGLGEQPAGTPGAGPSGLPPIAPGVPAASSSGDGTAAALNALREEVATLRAQQTAQSAAQRVAAQAQQRTRQPAGLPTEIKLDAAKYGLNMESAAALSRALTTELLAPVRAEMGRLNQAAQGAEQQLQQMYNRQTTVEGIQQAMQQADLPDEAFPLVDRIVAVHGVPAGQAVEQARKEMLALHRTLQVRAAKQLAESDTKARGGLSGFAGKVVSMMPKQTVQIQPGENAIDKIAAMQLAALRAAGGRQRG